MIDEFFKKRKVRKAFNKIVSPDVTESLLSGGALPQDTKHGRIEFALAFVRGETPDQVSPNIGRVADVAISHGATIHGLIGALVIMAFGTRSGSSPKPGNRAALIRALLEQLPGDVKIVHGAADGYSGLLGSNTLISYTFLMPHFDSILGALSRLQVGESEEFTR